MLLRVGELTKRTGLTVRALHHYDSIGLLRPSARADSGYRLYNRDDVARLHGIQTLRQMGVPLSEMALLLDGEAGALQAILNRQISALDQQSLCTQALRERLIALRMVLVAGQHPEIPDWLASLALMSTYEQHFNSTELKRALARWKQFEAEWPPLVQDFRAARSQGLLPGSVEIQPLVHRWIDLTSRWMEGDIEFLGRWGSMLRQEPGVPLPAGMDRELLEYIDAAVRQRMAVIARHFGPELQQRLAEVGMEWHALVQRGARLIAGGVPPRADQARELAREWQALKVRTVGGDLALWDRLVNAYETEPLLHAGMPITPALRRYVEKASGP